MIINIRPPKQVEVAAKVESVLNDDELFDLMTKLKGQKLHRLFTNVNKKASEKLKQLAVRKDWRLLSEIRNPSPDVVGLAVMGHPEAFKLLNPRYQTPENFRKALLPPIERQVGPRADFARDVIKNMTKLVNLVDPKKFTDVVLLDFFRNAAHGEIPKKLIKVLWTCTKALKSPQVEKKLRQFDPRLKAQAPKVKVKQAEIIERPNFRAKKK